MQTDYGTIYKITNLITKKIYIGQTRQTCTRRFNAHKQAARKGSHYSKLHTAMREYGEDNFIIEKIEECPIEQLNERERYWIAHYQSTLEEYGYNTQLGGQDYSNYQPIENAEEILEYYHQCHNQTQTLKHFNISYYRFKSLLLKMDLPTDKAVYGKHTRERVKIIELDKEFDSGVDCAKFFIENNICSTKKIECVQVRLSHALTNNKKIYGYTVVKI